MRDLAVEIDQILQRYTSSSKRDGSLHSTAFVVRGRDGRILYSGAAGKLNYETDEPYTEDSVSFLASMTKLITSIAVLQVVEKDLVGLDDDLATLIPEFKSLELLIGFDDAGKPAYGKHTNPITLRGFGYDMFDPDLIRWRALQRGSVPDTFAKPTTFEAYKLPLKFQPGDGWVYGVSTDWAGKVVEELTGLSLEDYFQQNIFQPLGLKSTTFRIGSHPELLARRATISLRTVPRGALAATSNPQPDNPPFDGGGQGLHSTASDYAKLLGALLDGGRGILKETTIRDLNQSQLPDPTALETHIFGDNHLTFAPEYPKGLRINHGLVGLLNVEDISGKRRAGSLTWSGVTNPRWWYDPKSGIAATLFVQLLPPGDVVVAELFDELERAVYKNHVDDLKA
ncbi:hypothetical protein LTR84_010208 [Exophiala bonariae]|uniref:Beta-lactamase-related domain-containing protein n=1 Tax=Exophiala bonariae TaxID=1690606 RepID=A0AAV9MVV4_9EURO|nr:hypothetical protein LTR84_010208 [Exophiala bonariae]